MISCRNLGFLDGYTISSVVVWIPRCLWGIVTQNIATGNYNYFRNNNNSNNNK